MTGIDTLSDAQPIQDYSRGGVPDHPADIDPVVHRRRWRILAVLSLSLVIVSLDNTVLNVALPSVQRALNASAGDLQWIVDSYTLVFAGLVLLGGNLSDRFGRKACLQLGLLVLAAGSALAVFTDTTATLVMARATMGVGGALIMPATLSITSTVFVGAERAKAIGVWSACAGIGVALGPVAGGWLVEHYWWGSIFLINIPIVTIAVIAGLVLLPASRDPATGPPDVAGAILSTIGITALVYAIIAAPDDGWTSAAVLCSLAAAVLFLVCFVFVELRAAHPMLPLSFFRSAQFSVSSLSISLTFFALIGSLFILTQYLQIVRGYTTLQAGVRTLPVAAGLALTSATGPALAARYGRKRVVAIGMFLTGCGLGTVAIIGSDTGYPLLMISLSVMGLGMGATMAPATESIMSAVPAAQAGVGSAVNDSIRQLSGALGVAVLGSLLKARYSSELAPQLRPFNEITATTKKLLLDSVAGAHNEALAVVRTSRISEIADAAFISAMNTTALAAAAVAIVGAVAVAAYLPDRESPIAAYLPDRESPATVESAGPTTKVSKRGGRHRYTKPSHHRHAERHGRMGSGTAVADHPLIGFARDADGLSLVPLRQET